MLVLITSLEKMVCGRSFKSASYSKHVLEWMSTAGNIVFTRPDLAKGVAPDLLKNSSNSLEEKGSYRVQIRRR